MRSASGHVDGGDDDGIGRVTAGSYGARMAVAAHEMGAAAGQVQV